ncbi:hypothetical protein BC828DRAFT_381972 [Blastocladiella britannica]|nr:hypothetical protein BC828DRAFT_381972 [Blastocladiella britannica]
MAGSVSLRKLQKSAALAYSNQYKQTSMALLRPRNPQQPAAPPSKSPNPTVTGIAPVASATAFGTSDSPPQNQQEVGLTSGPVVVILSVLATLVFCTVAGVCLLMLFTQRDPQSRWKRSFRRRRNEGTALEAAGELPPADRRMLLSLTRRERRALRRDRGAPDGTEALPGFPHETLPKYATLGGSFQRMVRTLTGSRSSPTTPTSPPPPTADGAATAPGSTTQGRTVVGRSDSHVSLTLPPGYATMDPHEQQQHQQHPGAAATVTRTASSTSLRGTMPTVGEEDEDAAVALEQQHQMASPSSGLDSALTLVHPTSPPPPPPHSQQAHSGGIGDVALPAPTASPRSAPRPLMTTAVPRLPPPPSSLPPQPQEDIHGLGQDQFYVTLAPLREVSEHSQVSSTHHVGGVIIMSEYDSEDPAMADGDDGMATLRPPATPPGAMSQLRSSLQLPVLDGAHE